MAIKVLVKDGKLATYGGKVVQVDITFASGEQTTVVEDNFKIWGKDATNTAENDIILSTANGYYDKNYR